jgi:hypothetical protein
MFEVVGKKLNTKGIEIWFSNINFFDNLKIEMLNSKFFIV